MKTILSFIFISMTNFLRSILFKLDIKIKLHNVVKKGESSLKKYIRNLTRYNPPNQVSKKFFYQQLKRIEEILKKYFREHKISESCLRTLLKKIQTKKEKLRTT